MRWLRGRNPRLHLQQGPIPPSGAPGRADESARLRTRGDRRDHRPRALLEPVEGPGLRLALVPLPAARGRPLCRRVYAGADDRTLAGAVREAPRRHLDRPAPSGGEGSHARGEELRLDPRARVAAADDAPVVARDDDASARAQDAPVSYTHLTLPTK